MQVYKKYRYKWVRIQEKIIVPGIVIKNIIIICIGRPRIIIVDTFLIVHYLVYLQVVGWKSFIIFFHFQIYEWRLIWRLSENNSRIASISYLSPIYDE